MFWSSYMKLESKGSFVKANWQKLYSVFNNLYDPLSLRRFTGEANPPVSDAVSLTHWFPYSGKKGFGELIILNDHQESWASFEFEFFDPDDKNRFIRIAVDCDGKTFQFVGSLDNKKKLRDTFEIIRDHLEPRDAFQPKVIYTFMTGKEAEEKFGILLSPSKAKDDFNELVSSMKGSGPKIAMFYLDIDDFKLLNDKHTEAEIDRTILPQAMRMVKTLSTLRGYPYREGGDEFVVILPNVSPDEAQMFGERLREGFYKSKSFEVNGEKEQLTVSVGVALWPADGKDYEQVKRVANARKRNAKKTKNICVIE